MYVCLFCAYQTDILNGVVDLNGLEDVVSATNDALAMYDGGPNDLGSRSNVVFTVEDYSDHAVILQDEVAQLKLSGESGDLRALILQAESEGYSSDYLNDLLSELDVDTSSSDAADVAANDLDPLIFNDVDVLDDLENQLTAAIDVRKQMHIPHIICTRIYYTNHSFLTSQELEGFSTTFEEEYVQDLTAQLDAAGEELKATSADIVAEVEKLTISYDPDDGVDLDDDIDKWEELVLIALLIPEMVLIVVFVCYLCGIGCGYAGKVIINN